MSNSIQEIQDNINEVQYQLDELELDRDRFDKSEHVDTDAYKAQFEDRTVEIMGITYNELEVQEKVDKVAFNQDYNIWLDNLDLMDIPEYEDIVDQISDLEEELYDLETDLEDLKD